MLVDILHLSELTDCLTLIEQFHLREVCRSCRDELRHLRLRQCGPLSDPSIRYFWIEDEEHQSIRWKQKLPSIYPRSLWSPLWVWIHELTPWLCPWRPLESRPICYNGQRTMRIGMEITVSPDTWAAIGICWDGDDTSKIVGFDPCSIGYHSDDNCVYHDSLRIIRNHCRHQSPVEMIGCAMDYTDGTLYFYRNGFLEFTWEMDTLTRPFTFCVSSNDTHPHLYSRCVIMTADRTRPP